MSYPHKYDYPVHPLAELFPPLPPDEFEKLKADIKAHGQLDPIVLSSDGTTLLDGRNRLRALKQLDMTPKTIAFSEAQAAAQNLSHALIWKPQTEGDYIWSRNVLRRHLTDDQRAAIAVKWSDAEKEAAQQRQRAHAGTAPGRPKENTSGESAQSVRTRTAIAKKAQVSEHKIRQAETLAAKVPDLVEKVAQGDVTLKDAIGQTTRPRSAIGTINLSGDTFNEQAVLVRMSSDLEQYIEKNWPKNRDLAPVIKKLEAFITSLEVLQNRRAAELQKKVAAIL